MTAVTTSAVMTGSIGLALPSVAEPAGSYGYRWPGSDSIGKVSVTDRLTEANRILCRARTAHHRSYAPRWLINRAMAAYVIQRQLAIAQLSGSPVIMTWGLAPGQAHTLQLAATLCDQAGCGTRQAMPCNPQTILPRIFK
jgi:hypothetical protein